ncbi:MAG: hypothetical protein ABMA64_10765 [Myxococcota bacterium]
MLIAACSAGDATVRERIVDEPLLFLKTEETLGEVDREALLRDDLEAETRAMDGESVGS